MNLPYLLRLLSPSPKPYHSGPVGHCPPDIRPTSGRGVCGGPRAAPGGGGRHWLQRCSHWLLKTLTGWPPRRPGGFNRATFKFLGPLSSPPVLHPVTRQWYEQTKRPLMQHKHKTYSTSLSPCLQSILKPELTAQIFHNPDDKKTSLIKDNITVSQMDPRSDNQIDCQ